MNQEERRNRYESQGRWLAIYSAISFFCLYFFPFYYEDQLYNNLLKHAYLWKDLKIGGNLLIEDGRSLYFYAEGIKKISLYDIRIEKIKFGYQMAGLAVLAGLAFLIGFRVYYNWLKDTPLEFRFDENRPRNSQSRSSWKRFAVLKLPWKLFSNWKIFFFAYAAASILLAYFHNFMFDFALPAVLYVGIIYIIRGVMRFNPHREIKATGKERKELVSGIMKIYQQYIFISLAAVGLISTTFLFAVQSAFRELYKDLTLIFPLIERPNFMAQIWLTLIGCAGLLIVTREFNMKQHEMFAMEFDDVLSGPDRARAKIILINSEDSPTEPAKTVVDAATTPAERHRRTLRLGLSHVLTFIGGWLLRGRRH